MSIVCEADFCHQLAAEFSLRRPVAIESDLYDGLGLTSLEAVELVLWVESLAEAKEPPSEPPALWTVADAYDYYVAMASAA